ncbi:MAG: hypothetical protein D6713_01635 [Deltaproteobacteria bacterium]|nr:MAG: hypothetical protein D6713_01635 [Deltaproteobacteria bacterium]
MGGREKRYHRFLKDPGKGDVSLKLQLSLALLLGVVGIGTIGFYMVEDSINSLFDSFYFTIVTITTIGYGDVTPTTTAGKLLDIFVIVFGVGTVVVSVQSVFEAVVRKKIEEVLTLPQKRFDGEDHIIVCGYGKVGRALVRRLRDGDTPFVVVENDQERVREMVLKGIPCIEGDARKEDVLQRAGIEKASLLFAPLDDTSNVFVTLTAKLLNPSIRVVAKVEDWANEPKLKKAGADHVISCHDIGAQVMVKVGTQTD